MDYIEVSMFMPAVYTGVGCTHNILLVEDELSMRPGHNRAIEPCIIMGSDQVLLDCLGSSTDGNRELGRV
jgi:hypothetical protein